MDKNPQAGPITLFLDKKQAWSGVNEGAKRRPADLDALVGRVLDAKVKGKDGKLKDDELLYKPASLQKSSSSLREAAQKGSWPTIKELAHKVIAGTPARSAATASTTSPCTTGQPALAAARREASWGRSTTPRPRPAATKKGRQ
jgi:hypothetical protein